jgi:hypothetical protein
MLPINLVRKGKRSTNLMKQEYHLNLFTLRMSSEQALFEMVIIRIKEMTILGNFFVRFVILAGIRGCFQLKKK